jgi:hypothetical protein
LTFFEAARWAPSSYNSQPWRFIYATRDSEHWAQFLGFLNDFNRSWASQAAALVIVLSKSTFAPPGATDDGGAYRQLHLVAVAAGIVRNIAADAKAYVTGHGRPVLHSNAPSAREDVFIQQVVGELTALSHTIDVLIRDNARVLGLSSDAILRADPDAADLVLEGALATARTQIVVGKLALQAGERLFDAGGASATSRKHNFDRHWRNLRTIFSHNPLHHKAKVIGDYVLNGVETHLVEGRTF